MFARVEFTTEHAYPAPGTVPQDCAAELFPHGNEGAVQVGFSGADVHPGPTVDLTGPEEFSNFTTQPEVGPAHNRKNALNWRPNETDATGPYAGDA